MITVSGLDPAQQQSVSIQRVAMSVAVVSTQATNSLLMAQHVKVKTG